MRGIAHKVEIQGRLVEYLLKPSRSAQRIRVRVGVNGVEVIQPRGRSTADVEVFLVDNRDWLTEQIARAVRLQAVRQPHDVHVGQILFRGLPMAVHVAKSSRRGSSNLVQLGGDSIIVLRGLKSRVAPAESLENWLRKRAREAIEELLPRITAKLRVEAGKLYVRGQRTRWGSCSAMRNLSFNWRIVMAPAFVLRYLVTHEASHLAVPDHSQRFWLTVQSLCPETAQARAWLSANASTMMIDLRRMLANAPLSPASP